MKRPRRWIIARKTPTGRTHWSLTEHASRRMTWFILGFGALFFSVSLGWALISCWLYDECGIRRASTDKRAQIEAVDQQLRQWHEQQQWIEQHRKELAEQNKQPSK